MIDSAPSATRSLYVHVPFCARKCSYCAFYSEPSSGETMPRYVSALLSEFERFAGDLRPITIFFGGGTPSLLTVSHWRRVADKLEELGWVGAAEWTIECNPATISLEKALFLRSRGVNRISMGVQSLDDELLTRLGRVHTREMVFKSFDLLRKAGFENINLDLMFAIPGQSLEAWQRTLDEVIAMDSEHLSSYEVIYEEDTALYAQLQAGQVRVDEDLACRMYEELVARATAAGFHHYEVANFAKSDSAGEKRAAGLLDEMAGGRPGGAEFRVPGRACLHNVNYWRGGSFCGFGPSATSYRNGLRTKNCANTERYCHLIETGASPVESSERLSPLGRAGETAAFGLRMTGGWPFAQFERITGHDLRKEWAREMEQLARRGWGVIESGGFRLTPIGLRFADAVALEFLR